MHSSAFDAAAANPHPSEVRKTAPQRSAGNDQTATAAAAQAHRSRHKQTHKLSKCLSVWIVMYSNIKRRLANCVAWRPITGEG